MDVEQQKTNFVKRVLIDEPEKCWLWLGPVKEKKRGKDYGFFTVGRYGKPGSVREYAHRMSYRFFKGEIPLGLHILHSCDNPRCVNPDHLSLGTHKENITDAKNKGRMVRGAMHYHAKLTEETVQEIRKLAAAGVDFDELARGYGVKTPNICNAVYGKTWAHVPGALTKQRMRGGRPVPQKLNSTQVREIRALVARGVLHQEIASKFGVSDGTISDIGTRRTWRHLA